MALTLVLAACADGREAPGVLVTDSAGVEIVTNHRTFGEVPVRALPDEPDREILDESLYQVTAVLSLPDGRLAVGKNGSTSVVIYDAEGAPASEWGREGDGPGEFRFIESLFSLPADSLGVYDPQPRRLTVFPLRGGSPRILNLAEVAPDRAWSRVHALESGLAFVGRAGLGAAGRSGVYRNSAPSHHIDLAGRVVSTYGEFPGLEAFVGNGMMGRAPFGKLLMTAAVGDRLIVGTGEHPELRMYGPDGDLNRIVRWAARDRTVTPERWDEFVEFMVSQAPPDQAAAARERLGGMPFAPEVPTHAEVIVAPTGEMWVGEYPGAEAEMPQGRRLAARRWVVFAADGAMRERIETPLGFMPMALTEDVVWGVYFDELDAESIRAYRIGS